MHRIALIVLATVFSMAWYKIVMQCSLVVYHEISHLSVVISWYTHSPKALYVYRENTSDKWDTPLKTTRKQCITSMYHTVDGLQKHTKNKVVTTESL